MTPEDSQWRMRFPVGKHFQGLKGESNEKPRKIEGGPQGERLCGDDDVLTFLFL